MSVSYTKVQRNRAKADGLHLATIAARGIELQGPVTLDESVEIFEFLSEFLKRRSERLKNERVANTKR